MFTRLLDLMAQGVEFVLRPRVGLGVVRLKFTRGIRLRRDFGEIALGGLDGFAELLFVRDKPLVADNRLAGFRLEFRNRIAALRRRAVAPHALAPRILQFGANRVDFRLGGLEGLFRRVEGFTRRVERIGEQLRLLRKRLSLHPDFLELPPRVGNLAPVALRELAVFGDSLGVHANDLVRTPIRAVRRRLFARERLQSFLQFVDGLVLRLLGGFRRGDLFRRLGNRLLDFLTVRRVLFENRVKLVDAVLRDVNVDSAQFVAQFLVFLRFPDLTLKRTDLPLHLAQNVRLAQQILLGLLDLAEGLLAVGLELRYARRLLEDGAAIFRLGRENRVNLPLRHHRIGTRADARAHEEVLHVLQSARLLVDEILARPVAIHAPRNRHLVVFRAEFLLAVGERNRDFGQAERLARIRAVEDDIHQFGTSERRRTLLAENPANRVRHVGLAASVRTDDGNQSGIEREARTICKTLKTNDI